ncbi:uncharacterized protein LOC129234812 [Uloborus diversus]|uniref:uncharacterized protein LOC129234812 n=1 Tax=Uloborus diversus TaxID=327109 RepID=UPI00240A79FC|nr:uncharacterized protein LOC129234812 [Uloborus diversus]
MHRSEITLLLVAIIFTLHRLEFTSSFIVEKGKEWLEIQEYHGKWKASSDLYDLSYDLNSSTLASCRADMEWKFPYYPRLRRDVTKVPVRDFGSQAISCPEITPLIVNFHDEVSYFPELSGGKGSSLGKLIKLSKEEKTFIVPKGIIITTAAYSEFLNQEIEKEIQNLEDVIYGKVVGDVEETCDKVISVISRTTLPHKICREIESHLNVVFDGHHHHHKFAVRSSATSEDTEMMSAAGQMDSFLGVHGLKEVFSAIKKCWASQFSYVAVEYKRHNGQLLNCPMAVIVQDMVACEVAGVLFTCDPVTSNPSIITITGNYGLGESVVSGLEEPDTFFLHRSMADEITLKSLTIGAKNHRIVMQDVGGVVREDVPEEERNHCCLSNEMAEKLARIAIKIEKYYKSPRDIEWGIENGNIYVLQSRPVTNRSGEMDFEIKHEFDAPMRCEREYFSVCNIGEVLTGATTPLSIDLWFKYFRTTLTKVAETKKQVNTLLPHRYFESGCVSFYNHMMISVIDVISRMHSHTSLRSQGITIGIFGKLLEDEEIFLAADERYKKKSGRSLKSYYHFLKDLFFAPYGEKLLRKYLERDFFSADFCTTSEEIFSAILSSCSVFDEALDIHVSSTEGSSAWNMFLFTLLGNAKGGYDTDVYSDFARLLSVSKNVESADVPSTMQNLAHLVLLEMTSDEFKAMPLEKALAWFQKSTSEAGIQFRQFLKRHGHRCLKEFDMQSKSWAMDPKPLVQFLQNLSGTCESPKEKKDDDIEKILSELQVPLDFRRRCLIKFLLPHCRRAVGERERCKSLLIKAFDNWRKGFRTLSRLMVFEGRIPDADLIYFLTIDEIKDLLRTRSPKLIQRYLLELDKKWAQGVDLLHLSGPLWSKKDLYSSGQ